MARLSAEDSLKTRQALMLVALKRFSRSGFNGVTMREIADDAGIPLGSIYNYFEDKTALFKAVIDETSADFLSPRNELIRHLFESDFPNDLHDLADSIKASIKNHEPYFKLMYVDVVEFDGLHIREVFSNLDEKFRAAMSARFEKIGPLGPKGIDPAFAFVSIYLSLYQYFVLTKLFGATRVFGKRTDTQVVDGLVELMKFGIGGGAR